MSILLILFLILQVRPISDDEMKMRNFSKNEENTILLRKSNAYIPKNAFLTTEKNEIQKIQQISMKKTDDSELDIRTKTKFGKNSIFFCSGTSICYLLSEQSKKFW